MLWLFTKCSEARPVLEGACPGLPRVVSCSVVGRHRSRYETEPRGFISHVVFYREDCSTRECGKASAPDACVQVSGWGRE